MSVTLAEVVEAQHGALFETRKEGQHRTVWMRWRSPWLNGLLVVFSENEALMGRPELTPIDAVKRNEAALVHYHAIGAVPGTPASADPPGVALMRKVRPSPLVADACQ